MKSICISFLAILNFLLSANLIKLASIILVPNILGLVDKYRIKTNLFAISPNHAIKVFQQKYPKAEDIYVIQNLFKVK